MENIQTKRNILDSAMHTRTLANKMPTSTSYQFSHELGNGKARAIIDLMYNTQCFPYKIDKSFGRLGHC